MNNTKIPVYETYVCKTCNRRSHKPENSTNMECLYDCDGHIFPFVRTHYTVKEFEERENHWQNIMTQIRNLAYVKGYKDGARQFVEV